MDQTFKTGEMVIQPIILPESRTKIPHIHEIWTRQVIQLLRTHLKNLK